MQMRCHYMNILHVQYPRNNWQLCTWPVSFISLTDMCSFHWQKCEPRSKLFIPLDIFSSFRGIYTLFSLCAVYCYWLTRGTSHFYEERAYPHWQQNCLFRQIFCHHPTLYKCGWFVATWQFFAEADKFSIASPTKFVPGKAWKNLLNKPKRDELGYHLK